jgi:hypothetical protein
MRRRFLVMTVEHLVVRVMRLPGRRVMFRDGSAGFYGGENSNGVTMPSLQAAPRIGGDRRKGMMLCSGSL